MHETKSLPYFTFRNGCVAVFPRAVKIQGIRLGKVMTSLHSQLVVEKAVNEKINKTLSEQSLGVEAAASVLQIHNSFESDGAGPSLLPYFHS